MCIRVFDLKSYLASLTIVLMGKQQEILLLKKNLYV